MPGMPCRAVQINCWSKNITKWNSSRKCFILPAHFTCFIYRSSVVLSNWSNPSIKHFREILKKEWDWDKTNYWYVLLLSAECLEVVKYFIRKRTVVTILDTYSTSTTSDVLTVQQLLLTVKPLSTSSKIAHRLSCLIDLNSSTVHTRHLLILHVLLHARMYLHTSKVGIHTEIIWRNTLIAQLTHSWP